MCVSNLFNCLIRDHQFQNKRLKTCTRNLESKRLLVDYNFNIDIKVSCSLYSVYYNNTIAWRPNYVAASDNRKNSISMILCCPPVNGLFCVSPGPPLGSLSCRRAEIFLWNATINELRRLPYSSHDETEETEETGSHYGLGYDSFNDDYVVVRMIIKRYYDNISEIEVELYFLKKDSWMLIDQPFPYTPYHDLRDTTYFDCYFVNGRFHWMVLCDNQKVTMNPYDHFSPVIVSLDGDFEFKDIPQPNYTKELKPLIDRVNIVVLDGLLCVCCNYVDQACFDLWAMKEYSVQQSWMIMLSISTHDASISHNWLVPLYLFENGEVLLKTYYTRRNKHNMFVYRKDMELFEPILGVGNEASYIYTETLISPHRYISTPAALRIIKLLMEVSRDRLIQYVSY